MEAAGKDKVKKAEACLVRNRKPLAQSWVSFYKAISVCHCAKTEASQQRIATSTMHDDPNTRRIKHEVNNLQD